MKNKSKSSIIKDVESRTRFVTEVLDFAISKNQKPTTMKRLTHVVGKEYEKIGTVELEILERLAKIEEVIKNNEEKKDFKSPQEVIPPRSKPLPDYIDPRNTSKFLLDFNQNVFLKSTSHKIDDNLIVSICKELNEPKYSFAKHLEKIQSDYKELKKRYKTNSGLIGKIDYYILGNKEDKNEDGWSEDKIKFSWSSINLMQWSEVNNGKCPNPDDGLNYPPYSIEPPIELKNAQLIENFSQLVLHFKNQITISAENSLKSLCKRVNFTFRDNIIFDIDAMPERIKFLSDVEKIEQAYKKILTLCLSCSENGVKPLLKIDLMEGRKGDDRVIILSIHHKNTIFQKTNDDLDVRYGDVYTEIIKNQINGICDLELIAKFENNECTKRSLWPKEGAMTHEDSDGVKYNLIFYR